MSKSQKYFEEGSLTVAVEGFSEIDIDGLIRAVCGIYDKHFFGAEFFAPAGGENVGRDNVVVVSDCI